mmetsp:Transcript_125200/g.389753  ORF Transcript_125200/g.389753 Transcript_125200/m.389753 type:complete len:370 (+) Transcript_125200:91-1200(+)
MGTGNCKCDDTVAVQGVAPTGVEKVTVGHLSLTADVGISSLREEDDGDPRLTVAIAGAGGLRDPRWIAKGGGRVGCRCSMEVPMRPVSAPFRTPAAQDALAPTPVWRAMIPVANYKDGTPLHFAVIDEGGTGAVLGRATLEAAEFDVAQGGLNAEVPLQGSRRKDAFLKVKIRNRGQEFPPGPPMKFVAAVDKAANRPAGLDVDIQDGLLALVLAVKPGPIDSYNKTVDPSRQVRRGDFIEWANSFPGDTLEVPSIMEREERLALTMRRAEELTVLLRRTRSDESLGLLLRERPCGRTLAVVDVDDGLMRAWNEAHPDFEVRPGDRILEVNGQSGKAAELLAALKGSEKIVLTVVRPAKSGESGAWRYW